MNLFKQKLAKRFLNVHYCFQQKELANIHWVDGIIHCQAPFDDEDDVHCDVMNIQIWRRMPF